jgi:hypothetical protein
MYVCLWMGEHVSTSEHHPDLFFPFPQVSCLHFRFWPDTWTLLENFNGDKGRFVPDYCPVMVRLRVSLDATRNLVSQPFTF